MTITTYAANKTLDQFFGSVALGVPATYYFGLSTTVPTVLGGNVSEPVGLNYSRVAVTNGSKSPNWTTAASGSLSNAASITFAESTGDWGTILYCLIYDASTSGNLWFYDVLTPSRACPINTTIFYSAGGVVISMT